MPTTLTHSSNIDANTALDRASHHAILKAILDTIEANTSQEESHLLKLFAQHYYKNVSIEDLQNYPISTLYQLVRAHWSLCNPRKLGECKIYFHDFDLDREALTTHYTALMVSTDDMPFIVDSLCMEMTRQGFINHFMIHLGHLSLQRDAQGNILEVSKQPPPENKNTEALVLIVIDKPYSQEALTGLETKLKAVISEVRAAVTDWQPMKSKMATCLAELYKNPPAQDPDNILEESTEFLNWLLKLDRFIFLGCREYRLSEDQKTLRMVRASSLGVLRDESASTSEKSLISLPPEARQLTLSPQIVVFATTNTKSRTHRPVYTEYIGIKRFNEAGELLGECRFIGLYTSTVYQCDARTIPLVRQKIDWVLKQAALPSNGHASKALLDILLSLPRVELFQVSADLLLAIALGILSIQERPTIRLFLRQDSYKRFMSCLVFIPKERLTTDLQKKIESILMQAFSGVELSFETVLGESKLARIHFLIRTYPKKIPQYDVKKIEAQLIEAARSWQDHLKTELFKQKGIEQGTHLFQQYREAFPGGYREKWSTITAVSDIQAIEKLSSKHPLEMDLYTDFKRQSTPLRFRLFQIDYPIILSSALAILEKMGLQVIDEWPTEVHTRDERRVWIHDFGLKAFNAVTFDIEIIKPLFQEAFQSIWHGDAENDRFNQLILTAGLTWREVAVLRAYTKYMQQIGIPFSQTYVESAVTQNLHFVQLLIELFKLRFDPTYPTSPVTNTLEQRLKDALDAVKSLDEDRILRQLWELIQATLRTNFFQVEKATTTGSLRFKAWISFKLNSAQIIALPKPTPLYDIYVDAPYMKGIHLRKSKVARGGIRWSDRHEDFRTEVLGLMKAQQVKNAVIVPAGAKGGFVCKNLPTQGDRDTIEQHVILCYQTFIRGLLDITDNLQEGKIIPPANTICYDDEDPYLVVAADKGTARFSDIANQVAAEYNFWLGDAFASGGSQGYDHKKMGITARGAWESIKCHCYALGIDPSQDDFTVVGIGDMSGDVFGNGMLLSEHIKLVAAFNHLHIFIDPTPDSKQSFLERKRLFELPRSSWADYNSALISSGGGVFSRSQKSIPISKEIRQCLHLMVESLTPDELIQAILKAPVDVLWNGGIGTYVKATQEQSIEVGDKSNDAVRVNAKQLRCRMVGEGGNLGFTQLARVEYALKGGLIYTDFIDNSAGVDCSDHEVNCKILLNTLVTKGVLSLEQRNQLLVQMTQDIAQLVLADNYHQTRAITLATSSTYSDIELYRSYLNTLEQEGQLDRALEYLPDNQALSERKALGKGLTSPEVAILLAYTKIVIKADLLKADEAYGDNQYLSRMLASAFPSALCEKYAHYLHEHSLRREIIATKISNRLINDMGITFVYRLKLETGADISTIVRAYAIVRRVLGLEKFIQQLESSTEQLPLTIYYESMHQIHRLVRRAARWFIDHYKGQLHDIAGIVERFTQPVTYLLNPSLSKWLPKKEQTQWKNILASLEAAGVTHTTGCRIASVEHEYAVLDIVNLALQNEYPLELTARAYFTIGAQLEFGWLRDQIKRQTIETHWDTLARVALLDELDTEQCQLTQSLLRFIIEKQSHDFSAQEIPHYFSEWKHHYLEFNHYWQRLLTDLRGTSELKLMIFSVAIRSLTGLTRRMIG